MTKKRSSIADILKVRRMYVPTVGGDWVDPACYVGLEIEAEGLSYYDTSGAQIGSTSAANILNEAGWDVVADHSLRGDGVEFRFSEPMLGTQLTAALDTFFSCVKYGSSPRAGTHIHLDWTAVDEADSVNRMVAILYAFEQALFSIGGGGRKECVYCKPLSDIPPEDLRTLFSNSFEVAASSYLGGAIKRQNNDLRYFGTNLVSLAKFGSMELRHFASICDRATLETWINVVMALRSCAIRCTLTPYEILRELSTPSGIVDFATKWFSEKNISSLLLSSMAIPDVAVLCKGMADVCECKLPTRPKRKAATYTYNPAAKRALGSLSKEALRVLEESERQAEVYRVGLEDAPRQIPAGPARRRTTTF